MQTQKCSGCGNVYPMTREHFGNTPNGNFRTKCRACVRAHVAAHSAANVGAASERAELRRQRIAAAGGRGYTDADVERIRNALGDRCAYCADELNGSGHVDHKTPIAKGGRDEPANITLACEKCNLAKHAKDVEEFLRWRAQRGLLNRHPRVV
ncbi:HNH endonuclease [Inhella crocodyli]|uniref:HNH endonuclease n=1 Tax=Inhella crocodyli TaxID=2499851 RepID=A0A3S2XT90_9BURK|nr:HNH endonuclease [Inhella crocodyli]